MNLLFIDIETIPETEERIASYKATFEPTPVEPVETEEIVEKPKKAPKKPRTKKSARGKSKSELKGLHYLTGKIVCIALKPMGKEPLIFHGEEEVMLRELHEYLSARFPYTLCGYNIMEFDVPFIRMRGLKYGIDFSGLLPLDKFNKQHVDLYVVLGGKWGLTARLSELAWYFDIPGAYGSGADVERLYRAGDLLEIYRHCGADVCVTEGLYHKIYPEGRRGKA
jgi:DNA polymerase elongation subunit (family B)